MKSFVIPTEVEDLFLYSVREDQGNSQRCLDFARHDRNMGMIT